MIHLMAVSYQAFLFCFFNGDDSGDFFPILFRLEYIRKSLTGFLKPSEPHVSDNEG